MKKKGNQRMQVYTYISNNRHLLTKPLSTTETQFLDLLQSNQCTSDYFSQWFNLNRNINLTNDILNLVEYKQIPVELVTGDEDLNCNVFGDFTPEPIHYDIYNHMNKRINYSLSYNQFQVNVQLNSNLKDKIKRILVNDILFRSLILQAINPINIKKKTLELELFPSKHLKQLALGNVLGPDNINSGVTTYYYSTRENNKTMVFRKEEMKKLVLHELIHNLGYDFVTLKILFSAHLYFNISPDQKITINESYTECIACILNCMISSYEINNRRNFKLFSYFLIYEISFNLFQTAKILLHYGFDSAEDFIHPYNNKSGEARFNQNTSVFSYFFVKTGLLFSLSKFADFLENYTDHFYITKKARASIAYKKLIIECCRNKEFIKALNHFITFIKNKKIPDFLRQTLRMTCIEV